MVRQSEQPPNQASGLKRVSAGSLVSIGPLTIRYRLASVRRSPPRHSWLRLGGSREALDKDIAPL